MDSIVVHTTMGSRYSCFVFSPINLCIMSLLLITASLSLYRVTFGRVGKPNHNPISSVSEFPCSTRLVSDEKLCLCGSTRFDRDTPAMCSQMFSKEQTQLSRVKSSMCPVSGVPM